MQDLTYHVLLVLSRDITLLKIIINNMADRLTQLQEAVNQVSCIN